MSATGLPPPDAATPRALEGEHEASGNANQTSSSLSILEAVSNKEQAHVTGKQRERAALLREFVGFMATDRHWIETGKGPRPVDAPLGETELMQHAKGARVYGLCPLARGGDTVLMGALDFDSHKGETPWTEMLSTADMVATSLSMLGFHPILFKSSSGKGVHLYVLFDTPQSAHAVRECLSWHLEQCGLKPGTAGVAKHEVEVFPRQVSVAGDGWGNMLRLPFSGKSEPIGKFTGWVTSPDVPHVEPPAPRERTVSDAPDIAMLRSALAAIPNDAENSLSYDDFRNVVFGIHHATDGSDEGLQLAIEFSAKSPKHDEDFLSSRIWPYVRSDRGGAVITARTIFQQAAAAGWSDPSVLDAFDVLDAQPTARVAQSRELRLLSIDEVMGNVGPVDYLIDDWLERNVMGTVVGDPGAYKTFLAVDWALCVATGRAWHGNAVKPGAVVYVAGEGHNGFGRRLGAWLTHHRVEFKGLPFCKSSRSVPLMDKKAAEQLEREAKSFADSCGQPLRLVVVDTFARNFGDGDENTAKDVNRFVEHVDRYLREPTGAAVVVVHHTGLAAKDRGRGSSALKGATDFEYLVEKPEPLACLLTANRMKDAALPAPRQFRALSVSIDMEGANSLVLEHTGVTASARRGKADKVGANERLVMRLYQDLTGLGGQAPTPNELANAAKDQMGVTGARDRRRELAMKAINSVIAGGTWHVVEGRLAVVGGEG